MDDYPQVSAITKEQFVKGDITEEQFVKGDITGVSYDVIHFSFFEKDEEYVAIYPCSIVTPEGYEFFVKESIARFNRRECERKEK